MLMSPVCQLNIFWPKCFKVAKFGTVDAPREKMTPTDFQVKWLKVTVTLLIFEIKKGQLNIFFTPDLKSCQTWYSGCPLRVDVPY